VREKKRTNRLLGETSPYLAQLAHSAVDWHPWGENAIERARREDKPIFLSIGFSACHWCQVMERESFQDDTIARILKARYISIKVDREERPDIDQLYQAALQVLRRGSGGWPTNIWLTPDLEPYYAGTYFPPRDRGRLPGFARVLRTMADHYEHNRENVLAKARKTTGEVRASLTIPVGDAEVGREAIDQYMDKVVRGHDRKYGGFGGAPKFPPAQHLTLALRVHRRTGNPALLEVVLHTLDAMAAGGIYDHLGGGFHRYSTDVRWLIPHFEKMLYDNALLTQIYIDAYLITGKERYREVAAGTFDFIVNEMTSAEGGIYSTVHADTHGREGAYYLWSHAEVRRALGERDAGVFCDYYGLTEEGNFGSGQNVLHVARKVEAVAMRARLTCSELDELLAAGRTKLYEVRSRRDPPLQDTKIITSWNGLMIGALARGGRVFDDDRYVAAAARAASFLHREMYHDRRLRRTYRGGRSRVNGFLEDYAFLANGLIDLYEATFEPWWLAWASDLVTAIHETFVDPETNGLFYTSFDHEKLLARSRERQDSALPAGASKAVLAGLRLARLLDNDELRDLSLCVFRSYAARIREKPTAFATMLAALEFHLAVPTEIVVVGASAGENTSILRKMINGTYMPHAVIVGSPPERDATSLASDDWRAAAAKRVKLHLLDGKQARDGRLTVYVCRDRACSEPITEAAELQSILQEPCGDSTGQ
jgi:uncharacterized protein YyaL (SSP411 family)